MSCLFCFPFFYCTPLFSSFIRSVIKNIHSFNTTIDITNTAPIAPTITSATIPTTIANPKGIS